ncbi:MAG: putative glycoside hydrolase [Myxococcaceae bacterium]|nr:putative glycoside hydrolase [Myxococcaceae bacterium]
MVMAARGSIVGFVAVMMACSSRTPTPAAVETRDAGAGASADAGASASASADAGARAKEDIAPANDLAGYLKKSVPRGGGVQSGESVRVTHTVASGDTYPAIAAAYLELTEIYTAAELARAIEKKNPALVAGSKIEIPSVITRVPRDPREERLGFPEDKALRALFMTGPFVAQKWVESLDKMAARGINAVILDAKDYQGPVTYPTKAKVAVEIGAAAKPSIPDLARAIRFAHWRGIRVSLRIPCFHDPMADKKAKDGRLSLKSATTGQPVHIDWLDPTNVEAQDYAIEIAKEGVEAGADEINLDYVRFPVHITERFAKLPDPSVRSGIIRDFVKRVHAETKPAGVALSLDLFGVAATGARSDIDRLGQDIAVVGPEAEVIMPMVYPSHYDKGYNGWEHPGDHPEIVGMGTKAAVAQLKAAKADTVVRAWLQAFSWRTSIFGTKYVVDQANSAEKNGGTGWAMWSPACEYSAVYNGFPVKEKPLVVAKQ